MANKTGRPIAPARKLVAAVLGTISVFVMVFGLGLSSWPIVALGAALLALSIALGMVNVVRRGARAWVTGSGQVKGLSEPPMAGAYGRAELQITVVAPGLPINDVMVRDSRVPVGKWPRVGDTLPISVDVDDMRRVRILWEDVADRNDDGDPPPPPSYEPADEYPDDDLLGEPEPPPWVARDREWGRGPEEPPPPPGAVDSDVLTSPIVVHDTPRGPVLEGQFVDHEETRSPLPHRPRTDSSAPPSSSPAASAEPASSAPASSAEPAPGPVPASAGTVPDQGRPTGTKPSPHPRGAAAAAAATATINPETEEGTSHTAPESAVPPEDSPAPVVPEQRAAQGPGSSDSRRSDPPGPTNPHDHDIDLPLEGDPEPAPEFTAAARQAVDSDLIAPPAEAPPTGDPAPTPPAEETPGHVTARDETPTDPAPADKAADVDASAADEPPTITGLDSPPDSPPADSPADDAPSLWDKAGSAASAVAAAAAGTIGFAVSRAGRRVSIDDSENHGSTTDAGGTDDKPTAQRRSWTDLEGSGYEPDERADDLITAYPSARPGPAGAIHGIGITVLVTELPRSIAFYRDTLGFFEIDSGPGSAVLASGDTRLVLRTVQSVSSDIGRVIYLNLEVGDVEAVYEELKAKSVKFQHAPRSVNRGDKLELWAATFSDPDGHNIAITQWRAIR